MVGVAVAVATTGPPGDLAIVVYAAVLGVGIDLDHLLVARYNTGDWRALRRCLEHPRLVLFDQSNLLEPGEVSPLQRLFTHSVIGGVLVAVLVPVGQTLALVSAVVVYVHVLSDLAWENYRREGPTWTGEADSRAPAERTPSSDRCRVDRRDSDAGESR